MTDKAKNDIKTHDLDITNGACMALKGILPSAGWYENESIKIILAANEVNEMLSDLKLPEDQEEDEAIKWDREPYKLTVTENQREACKKCVKTYIKKAALRIIPSTAVLIRELGLAEE